MSALAVKGKAKRVIFLDTEIGLVRSESNTYEKGMAKIRDFQPICLRFG